MRYEAKWRNCTNQRLQIRIVKNGAHSLKALKMCINPRVRVRARVSIRVSIS